MRRMPLVAAGVALVAAGSIVALAAQGRGRGGQQTPTGTFFITSTGLGNGANLGGLAGADAHCAALAAQATLPAAQGRTWRAYLSAKPEGNRPAVNARDRIGAGPWHNVRGQLIASTVADLHGDVQRDRNNISKPRALDERGNPVNGFGDEPNRHDILTGSDSHGRAIAGEQDTTCRNWTSDGEGSAMVGHHDRIGNANTSWNSSHPTQGCSQEHLAASGGAGLFYCFAAN